MANPTEQTTAPLQSLIGARILVQAVKRNMTRFPQDFMFQLSNDEFLVLRSQTVTSTTGRGGRRTAPYAFTEQGVATKSTQQGHPHGGGRAIASNRPPTRRSEFIPTLL